jgi:heme/copper-type cytochrome/quinol oxidase subunit 4
MDLTNRESAEYWHQRAEEVTDPELRKEALATFRKFRKMAEREEKTRLRRLNPGYGVRSTFGWIMLVALGVLAVLLMLSKTYSATLVCSEFAFVLALCLVAAAITLRVYGHISEKTMTELIREALALQPASRADKTIIDGSEKSQSPIDASADSHDNDHMRNG